MKGMAYVVGFAETLFFAENMQIRLILTKFNFIIMLSSKTTETI